MGATSALHLRVAVGHAQQVLAIKALCAAQGLDFVMTPPADGVEAAHRAIRENVPRVTQDRSPAPGIDSVADLIGSGRHDDRRAEERPPHRARSERPNAP